MPLALGPVSCIEASSIDESTEGFEDAQVPGSGAIFFYLAQYDDPEGSSSYGTESAAKPREPTSGGCD
jgi:hypothetical protein